MKIKGNKFNAHISLDLPIGSAVEGLCAWYRANHLPMNTSDIISAALTSLFKNKTHKEVMKSIDRNRLFSKEDADLFRETITGLGENEAKECMKAVFQDLRRTQQETP